jgi:hypothetical protein
VIRSAAHVVMSVITLPLDLIDRGAVSSVI